ncbi:MAG: leucine-rich repeat domain-containing protein [Bacteroidota bacterium]
MKLKEFLGSYNSMERALATPYRVKKLSIRFPADINVYADEFLKFENLTELTIHTQLKHPPYIPGQIASVKKLRKLSVLNVPFTQLPEWVFGMSNLEYLMLRGNEAPVLPPSVANLQHLKTLRIENCEITALPPEIKMLKNLRQLSLSDTKVATLMLDDLPPNLMQLQIRKGAMDETELIKVKNFIPSLKISVHY